MKKLSEIQVLELDKIGEDNKCKFYFPPFDSRNNPFYKIDEIRKDESKYNKFISEIEKAGVHYAIRTLRRNKFLEITGAK